MEGSVIVEVCQMRREREHVRVASFPPGAVAGLICCLECAGTGWWGYGPSESVNGPCVECKGSGRVWVGLF